MLLQEVNFFIQGWRGFLVGQRRGWHAHHRWGVQASRGGYLLPRLGLQGLQLRRVASFVVELLSRGGHLWGFGFPGRPVSRGGLTWWTQWTPGTLSNSFFARAGRVHLVRQLRRLIMLRPRKRKLSRRRKNRRRWSKVINLRRREGLLQSSLLRGGYLRRLFHRTHLGEAFTRAGRVLRVGTTWPDLVPRRGGSRGWAQVMGHRWGTPRRGVPTRGGWRMWSPLRVITKVSRSIRSAQLRRKQRPQPRIYRGVFSGVSRVSLGLPLILTPPQRNPTRGNHRGRRRRYPQLGIRPGWVHPAGMGSGLPTGVIITAEVGVTLQREATRVGTPAIIIGSLDTVDPGLIPLWWNSAGVEGPRRLLTKLDGLAQRKGLFGFFWNRLACLAEW